MKNNISQTCNVIGRLLWWLKKMCQLFFVHLIESFKIKLKILKFPHIRHTKFQIFSFSKKKKIVGLSHLWWIFQKLSCDLCSYCFVELVHIEHGGLRKKIKSGLRQEGPNMGPLIVLGLLNCCHVTKLVMCFMLMQ